MLLLLQQAELQGQSLEERRKVAEWYKQIGNAVCPPVVRSIGERMLAVLSSSRAQNISTTEAGGGDGGGGGGKRKLSSMS